MARVLVINLGWEQQPLIEQLLEGNELYGIDENISKDKRFKHIMKCNLNEYEKMVEFGRDMKVEAVISDQCDYSLLAQYIVSDHLQLTGPTWEGAYYSNNKYMQRDMCRKQGILIPKYELVLNNEQVKEFALKVGFPIIIKPTDNRGSIGVTKVRDEKEISQALVKAQTCSKSTQVLAEEYIAGTQYTVDGYAYVEQGCKTLAIAEKTMINGDGEVAMEINYPALLSDEEYIYLEQTNQKVNNILNYKFGITHSEYIRRNGRFYLVESANRGGGCLTSALIIKNVSGIDLMRTYIDDCIGGKKNEQVQIANVRKDPVTLKFFRFNNGKIISIDGWDDISRDKNCIFGRLSVQEGMQISNITSDANRHGFIICRGDAKIARELTNRLTVDNDK